MTMIDRRSVLAGSAALLAAQAAPAAAAPVTLKTAAASRGRRFGSALSWGTPGSDTGSFANPAYAALLRQDCDVLVAENQMKWQAIRPAPDRFDFAQFDAMVDWAMRNGFAMRGHTLLWAYSRWFPAWLNDADFGTRPASEAARILTGHIDTVTRRYGRKIHSYDVVNEAVDPDTGTLRETSLSRAMGGTMPVLDLAFRTARATAPHAELVYNDYMSWEDGNEKHRAGVLSLLAEFRRRGTPVDSLGVQSHIGLFQPTTDAGALAKRLEPAWRRFLDRVTAMGYRLIVTEFDVRDRGLPSAIGPRDRGVADFARAYLDVMLSYPQLGDVVVWGLSDRYSWLRGFEPRPDGAIARGCPYDLELKPKPLRTAMLSALAAGTRKAG
ncbi:endo-1,4-beta-xylanase [Sphingomonas sp. 2R-10]|uniref:endo-1,4-beta-xylanase n=1 Tax=Sphingomonas sp. 2R-10 TaxID=3045148 RepID=UPI000F770A48|nr:endo-1,4-beta-xylanase [Sphingomonas sp. 2R-10]MDJ0277756.1 endo-1,4-beta-xylanase [Sphingomonas sp. 2R-10]